MSAPPGWYPDPTRRHTERYWAGARWTEHVRDRGVMGNDPLEVVGDRADEAGTAGGQEKTSTATAPPGWYPAPGVRGEERYWDGTRWTDYTRPSGSPEARRAVGAAARTNSKAVASLVLALVWLGGLASIAAIVLGVLARREIDRSGGGESGIGLAVAGIVVGALGLVVAVLMVGAFITLVWLLGQQPDNLGHYRLAT